ncbi:MAG: hypothetical protein KIG33_07275 [Oscillospiraceae bacterium]|nr:hypothetical protein [Oscillospiraceae bacterium]
MDIMQMGKNPNFLGSWDLYDRPNKKIVVTISDIYDEDVVNNGREERVTVCHFKEQVKPMILNLTNKKTIAKLYKTKDSEKLKGKLIEIGFEQVKAFGKLSDALRISAKIPTGTAPVIIKCECCGNNIQPFGGLSIEELAGYTFKNYGKRLCSKCAEAEKKKKESTENGTDDNNKA